MFSILLLLLALCTARTTAFQPLPYCRAATSAASSLTRLFNVIKADEVDFDYDVSQGGVRLAEECVIRLSGTVKHKPGSAVATLRELTRYDKLTSIAESDLPKRETGFSIITTGRGKELYKNPGQSIEAEVTMSPQDAVRDSLMGAASAMECNRVVINFAGSDDLQVLEVIQAVQELVLDLDVVTRSEITFHSLSHSSLPAEHAFVTVVGFTSEEDISGGLQGAKKSAAKGEVYFVDGTYWTVSADDLNEQVA